ncbi:MAG: DUF5686 family protein [Bacteroidia bacterium]|nr:DUF5686 and carboxypeptidase regulatory-like domain-containing protein [Bacteroidia bacterium]MDW8133651.1 DUF5686 family protein [Bacteroidia bacterium]
MRYFILTFSLIWGQVVSGVILDVRGEPVPHVIIQNLRSGQGTLSDLQGRFSLAALPTDTIELRCLGYEVQKVLASDFPSVFYLPSRSIELAPIVIRSNSDSAALLMQKAIQAGKRWNPLLYPHEYVSYNKLTLTLLDSVSRNKDSLPPILFIWESEAEKVFFDTDHQRETLRAQRVVGNLPIQTVLSPTALQSFSLYEDWLSILDRQLYSPLGKNALEYYEYEIIDTTYAVKETLYTLAFVPKRKREEWGMRGTLTISFPDAALHSLQGESTWNTNENPLYEIFFCKIQQRYEKLGDTLWFPVQLHSEVGLRVRGGEGGIGLLVKTRSFLGNIKIPPVKEKSPSRVEVIIPLRTLPPDSLQRQEPLTPEESFSYKVLDSLLSKVPVRRLAWLWDLPTLSLGRVAIGEFNLILTPLVLYHNAEGLRPQIGIETNDRLSAVVRGRGWLGYGTYRWAGTQGTPWRYGVEIEWGVLTRLRLYYYDDVRENTLPRLLDEKPTQLMGNHRPYERLARAYAFRWEEMVREKNAGLAFRFPIGSRLSFQLSGGSLYRISFPHQWTGYRVQLDIEYLDYQVLFRRGGILWRSEYKGPRFRFQGGLLTRRGKIRIPTPYLQGDIWHEWRWGRWAHMYLRGGGGWMKKEPLWNYRLRTLPDAFIGIPHALAAHPVQVSTAYYAFLFYGWTVPNTRFPSQSWNPLLSFLLQGFYAEERFYPEIGITLQRWVPQKLLRLFPSLSALQIGLYTPLPFSARNRIYVRIISEIFA